MLHRGYMELLSYKAKETGQTVYDFYHISEKKSEMLNDQIHFSTAGAETRSFSHEEHEGNAKNCNRQIHFNRRGAKSAKKWMGWYDGDQ